MLIFYDSIFEQFFLANAETCLNDRGYNNWLELNYACDLLRYQKRLSQQLVIIIVSRFRLNI